MGVVGEFEPEIGTAYSYASKIYDVLAGIISPEKDNIIDIWDCVKADVEALIQEDIMEQAYEDATQRLQGITDSLGFYHDVFLHWAHNSTEPCSPGMPGGYGVGDQAMSLFNLLQDEIPKFAGIKQQKPLLPYYVFVANLHFTIAADISEYGVEWNISSDVLASVREVSRKRVQIYSDHVMDVLVNSYIKDCTALPYDGCSDVYREIMDGPISLVPTWPILASFGLFNRSGVVIHNSHHMVSLKPEVPIWIDKEMFNDILFSSSRIYEQTICTSPDDIVFGRNDYLAWDGGWAGHIRDFSTGYLQWTFGKDPKLCTGIMEYTTDPRCTGCFSWPFDVSPNGTMSKIVGGGNFGVGGGTYYYEVDDSNSHSIESQPVMFGLNCWYYYPEGCYNGLVPSDTQYYLVNPWMNYYYVPDNYHIYNIYPTLPKSDIGDVMKWGNWIVLEYAPVQKSFDSLVVNGTTHLIPAASPNMEWSPDTWSEDSHTNEYLFGGQPAYSIGLGGKDTTYYNINTPPGIPAEKLIVGAFIRDTTASYSATIVHESGPLNVPLSITDVVMSGGSGNYTLYISGMSSIPSAIKKIAIIGTRQSLLGAIILSNDVGST